ncbi:MAG: sn-glycerol-1-phosphate dehydrogenase [Micropruina sp.]|uniref:sn-glycerol-1-phosphate dehydrogenase n=1 Tax=Micropruina sp. TaxID=2737536 RepID=UPI0039E3ED03
MPETLIEQALRSATDTRAIEIGRGVVTRTGSTFARLFPGRTALLVADENHWRVAGAQVAASLTAAGVPQAEPLILPGTPTLYASYANVELLRDTVAGRDATVVAVASGTLNDIAKRACGELGRPYLCVGTAASMDGYASFGASITTPDGFKQTLTCPAPAGVIADLDIMAGAPERLTATGFGDLIEKVPAGADWIIAEELGIEPIDPVVWELVQAPLRDALADPQGCRDGDPDALTGLAEGLIMSGLAMQVYQSSRPSSGGGHQFSHLWEMEHYGRDWEPPLSHGFKVGLGTLAVTALYERMLAADIPALIDIDAAVAAWPSWQQTEARLRAALSPELHAEAIAQTRAKYIDAAALRDRLELTVRRWPSIAERVRAQLLPTAVLQQKLDVVGAVTHPSQIGMGMDRFRASYQNSRWIRTRYVLVDLLTEANLIEPLVDELFAPGGYWAEC